MQRATIWILRAFCTLPAFSIKAITRLISIHLHLQKLSGRLQLRAYSLSYNHTLRLLFESRLSVSNIPHWLSLNILTNNQHLKIKGSIVNMDNRFNEVFPLFDPFNKEFFPGFCLINIFSNHFSFYLLPKQGYTNLKPHIHSLNDITIKSFLDLTIALVVSDASIRNQIATSISHIHIHNRPIIKMLHHAVNITFMKAELFTIRCGINQATNLIGINKIIVITDFIHFVKKILDYSSYFF